MILNLLTKVGPTIVVFVRTKSPFCCTFLPVIRTNCASSGLIRHFSLLVIFFPAGTDEEGIYG